MGSIYLACTIEDANQRVVACHQDWKQSLRFVKRHGSLSTGVARLSLFVLYLETISRLPVTPPPLSRLKCDGTKEPYPESNLLISYFPYYECICSGLTPLIPTRTQLYLTTLFFPLLGSSRGQDWYNSSPVPLSIIHSAVLYHPGSTPYLASQNGFQ